MKTSDKHTTRTSLLRINPLPADVELKKSNSNTHKNSVIKALIRKTGRLAMALLVANLFFSQKSFGQIIAWEFSANSGGEASVNSTTTNANLTVSTISRGSALSIPPSGGNRFTGTFDAVGYSTSASTLAASITAQDYFQFTISAAANFKVSLSSLDANFLRSSTNAPSNFQWQYSLDGFATAGINIGSTINYTGNFNAGQTNGTAQTQINLSSISALQNVVAGTNITIRLYGWSAGSTASTFALGRLTGNDLAIGGTVVTTLTAPTIITQPSNQTFCQGASSVSFTAAANGNPAPTVKWQLNSVDIPGATSTTYTISSPTVSDNGSYRAVFTNSQGNASSNAATLLVNALPIANIANQTNITCFGASDGTITVSATGGTSPYTFSIVEPADFKPATGVNLRLFTGLLPNTPYRIRIKDNNGCISH
jgi:hypothetical protein